MKLNINDIVIDYQGNKKTIGIMVSELDNGRASYWHWHTLINKFDSIFKYIKHKAEYGILFPDEPLIFDGLESNISRGIYNKPRLMNLIKRYEFLLNEEIRLQEMIR
jgi:hypothetical protein